MLMVVVAAAALLVVVVMLMLMVVVAAGAMLIMVMMVMVLFCCQTLHFHLCQFFSQRCLALHCRNQLLTGQFAPGSGNKGSNFIMLTDQGNRCIQLVLCDHIGTRQNDGGCGFDLVVVELTKVLHVNLHLTCIADSNGIAQSDFIVGDLLNGTQNIGQLANTGGFDDNTVRIVLGDHFLQSLAKVTDQAAADATGIHFGDVDAGILQEAAVNTNLSELIFDQNQLLTLVSLRDHLLDQGSLTGTQETRVNVNFCHNCTPSVHKISPYIIAPIKQSDKKKIFADST